MIQDLVSDEADHLERLSRSDRVYKHIAMNTDEMLRVQDAILILRSVRSHIGLHASGDFR